MTVPYDAGAMLPILAADVSGIDLPLPAWVSDVSVVGIFILFGIGLARGWLYTGGQVNHLLSQYEKVAALWEKVATERQETIELLSSDNEAVLKGNEAILRAVEELQLQQELARRMPLRNEPGKD